MRRGCRAGEERVQKGCRECRKGAERVQRGYREGTERVKIG